MPGGVPDDMFMTSASRPSLFDAWTDRPYNFFGRESPFGGGVLDMIMPFAFSSLTGSRGFMPGQFLPGRNAYDQMAAAQYQNARWAAVQSGFQADAPGMVQNFRSLAGAAGIEFGPDQLRAATNITGYMGQVLPFVGGMAPGAVDAMFGFRGSRGVAADVLFRRGMHEVDPVTGRIGLSQDTVSDRISGLYHNLYERGGPSGLAEMRGMGIGQAAGISAEMSRWGLGPRSISMLTDSERSSALKGAAETPETLRNFDTTRTGEAIRGMVGAVSAIRDLFGEHGQPDAPMATLFKALNDLTQGGLQFQNPQQLEMNVRTAQSLMRAGGLGLDAYASLVAKAGSAANAAGVDQGFGAQIAQGSAAAGIAYNTTGLGQARGPGALSREQYVAEDLQLRASAAGSGQANGIAALLRSREEIGPLDAAGEKRLQDALAGKVLLGQGEAQGILARNYGAGTAAQMIGGKAANAEYAAEHNLSDVVRRQQPLEAQNFARTGFNQALRGVGVDDRLTDRASAAMTEALFNMRPEEFSNGSTRSRILTDVGMSLGLSRDQAASAAAAGFANFGRQTTDVFGKAPVAALQLFNKGALDEVSRRTSEARQDAEMSRAMSAVGRHGPMARLAEIIRGGGSGSLVDDIATFLGGIPIGEAGEALGKDASGAGSGQRLTIMAGAVQAALRDYEDVKAAGGPDSEARTAALTRDVGVLVGGDATQASSSVAAFQDAKGLSRGQMASLERGEDVPGVSATEKRRIRGLMFVATGKGGLTTAAEKAGVASGSHVSSEELNSVATRIAALDNESPNLGAMGSETRARFGRRGLASLEEAERISGLALADASGATAAALGMGRGAGTVKKIQEVQDATAKIRAMAASEGVSVEDLLASSSRAGQDARGILSGIGDAANELTNQARAGGEDLGKLPATDPRRQAYDAESAKLKSAQEANTDPAKAAKTQLEAILKQTGVGLSEDKKKELIQKIAGSRNPAVLMSMLGSQADAEMRSRTRPLSPAGVEEYLKKAGGLGDLRDGGVPVGPGRAGDVLDKAISSAEKKLAPPETPKTGPVTLKFAPDSRIKIDDDHATFTGSVVLEGDVGSTVA